MLYKAKITKVNIDNTFNVKIPSLGMEDIVAHYIGPKNQRSALDLDDLVMVEETNDYSWVIIGYVYGQKG